MGFYEYDEEDATNDAVFCVFEGNDEPFIAVSDAFYAIDGLCFWGCEDIMCKIISFLQHSVVPRREGDEHNPIGIECL
ncbi:MAG TPA: hypothetical protein PLI74_13030 [Candidatus Kapabacteria bacterium]|nr:hypothetical protein [Ignavibacteria bacterium]HRK60564.1 hypothetical protein [Candidatus Kapabacteria bacterium]